MNKVTSTQVTDIGEALLTLGTMFGGGTNVGVLRELFAIGTKFNTMMRTIKEQTEADAPEVWAQVTEHYDEALAAYKSAEPPTV